MSMTYLLALCALLGCTHQASDVDILRPKADILAQLDHIEDEMIRNITATQLWVCPESQLCSTNIELRVDDNHAESARKCCSQCDCTPTCVNTNRCCVDYKHELQMDLADESREDQTYQCIYPNYNAEYFANFNYRIRAISACPNMNTLDVLVNKWFCESDYRQLWLQGYYRSAILVTDKVHMITYKNMFCARCHGLQEEDVIVWTISIQSFVPYIYQTYNTMSNIDYFIRLAEMYREDLDITFLPPALVPPDTYICVIEKCNHTLSWKNYNPLIEFGCLYYRNVYRHRYRNVFCAICNNINVDLDSCDPDDTDPFDFPFSYIGILDFNLLDPPGRRDSIETSRLSCPNGFILDKVTMGCRELSCTELSNLVNNRCELIYTQVKGYNFLISLAFLNTVPIPYSVDNIRSLYENFTTFLFETADTTFANLAKYGFETQTDFSVIIQSQFQNTSRDTYQHISTDIFGFGYAIHFQMPKHEKFVNIRQVLEEGQKLHDIYSFGTYAAVQYIFFLEHMFKLPNDSVFMAHFTSHLTELQEQLVLGITNIKFNLNDTSLSNTFSGFDPNLTSLPDPFFSFENISELSTPKHDYLHNLSLSYEYDESEANLQQYYKLIHTVFYPTGLKLENDNEIISIPAGSLCTHVKFGKNEFLMTDTQFIILPINLTLSRNQANFCPTFDSLCICLDVFENAVRKYLNTNSSQDITRSFLYLYTAEAITSLTITTVSILSSVLTLVIYLTMNNLRSAPGLITMALTFHLIVFQALYVVSNSADITKFYYFCIVNGIIFHFFFLSYIFWMNISTFHMYQTFTKTGIKFFNRSRFHPKKLLLKYSIYVYIMAIAFIGLNILVSMARSDWSDLGYGQSSCYVNSPLMIGLSTGLPLGCVLVSNMYMFIRTMCHIVTGLDFSMTRSGGITEKDYLTAFLKLSILTGVTWILGLVHQWTNVKVIGYLYIVLNAGHGALLLFAFVPWSHVKNRLKARS